MQSCVGHTMSHPEMSVHLSLECLTFLYYIFSSECTSIAVEMCIYFVNGWIDGGLIVLYNIAVHSFLVFLHTYKHTLFIAFIAKSSRQFRIEQLLPSALSPLWTVSVCL